MKNYLIYYYNINIIDITLYNNDYLLLDSDNNYYYLCLYDEDKMNINYILKIYKDLDLNNSSYYQLLFDKNGNILNKYDDKLYILLKVKGLLNTNIYLKDIINNNNKYKTINSVINLEELWSRRIDYLEYQVSELGKDKKEIIDTFSFFDGIAENAISFLNINNINYKNANISLSHNRIFYPNVSNRYYNPLNIMIDYSVRDLAEYLKEKLFSKEDISKDIDYILDSIVNRDDLIIFYARLLFPSTYFDLIEEILLNNCDEELLDKYVLSINDYLLMLQDVYYKINKKNHIMIASWIKGVR